VLTLWTIFAQLAESDPGEWGSIRHAYVGIRLRNVKANTAIRSRDDTNCGCICFDLIVMCAVAG
jgi:hypothetical protein